MAELPPGFLIALPLTEIQAMNYKELPGLVFVFESNQAAHYKNQRMFEMDASYGKFSTPLRAYLHKGVYET